MTRLPQNQNFLSFLDVRDLTVCLRPSPSACRERCGVIKIRQSATQRHRKEREAVFQSSPAGLRRLTRKRYIDLGKKHKQTDPQEPLLNSRSLSGLPRLYHNSHIRDNQTSART